MARKKSRANRQKKEKVVVTVAETVKKTKKKRNRAKKMKRRALALTKDGIEFLHCAVAPRDFPGLSPRGVPDTYGGPSMVFRHQMVTSVSNSTTGPLTKTLLFLPTPGVACWTADNTAATPDAAYTPITFPDFASIFGSLVSPPYGAANVDRFRYLSYTFELVMVSPVLTSGGSINAARVPGIEVVEQVLPDTAAVQSEMTKKYISGTSAVTVARLSTMPGFYTGHVNDGIYGWSVNESGNWDFSPLWIGTAELHSVDTNTTGRGLEGSVMGWGNMTPMALTLSGLAPGTEFQLLVDSVVEYTPVAGSLLARMSSPSSEHDPLALETYGEAARSMVAFVPRKDNAGFWNTFLRMIGAAAGAVAPIFGPVGQAVSLGLSTITNGLATLFT